MRKLMVATTTVTVLLAGCAGHRLGHGGPDEFAVARQAPLVIPPDYALAPPTPGAARTQDTSLQAQTLEALFGGSAPRSQTERNLIGGAGGDTAENGIRSGVGDPKTNVVDKGQTTRDIVAAPQGDGQDARAVAK